MPASSYSKWEQFDDSDDEDLHGGAVEREAYTVVATGVGVLEAPEPNAGILDMKNKGETLSCDARAGSWVRLCESFALRGRPDVRGWAMIDDRAGAGVLLARVERSAPRRPPPTAAERPAAAATSSAPPAPKRIDAPPGGTGAPHAARAFDMSKWDALTADIPNEPTEPSGLIKGDPLHSGLRPLNPAAMHQMGLCWSDSTPPVTDRLGAMRERILKQREEEEQGSLEPLPETTLRMLKEQRQRMEAEAREGVQ
jgi:hypothetical protein